MPPVLATAPVRIADLGGWTDTWFAEHGRVLSLAVTPRVEVRVEPAPGGRVRISAEDFGDRYVYDGTRAGPHPLIEAAVDEARPAGIGGLDVRVRSAMPPGAGTGTSAAVVVALIGALDCLAGRRRGPLALAAAAHAVEVARLGRQSGIQDQIAAACGGVSFIEMDAYPHATVTPVPLAPRLAASLEQRLVVISLGRAHCSSAVHEAVIAAIGGGGAPARVLDRLRRAADEGRAALLAADLDAFGRALIANTEGQAELHEALVSRDARRIFTLAAAHGASGWKVNGAGGDGGSVTVLLGPEPRARGRFLDALAGERPDGGVIPVRLSPDGMRAAFRDDGAPN